MKIREPAVAGSFYPSDKDELKSKIRSYVENSKLYDLPNLKGLVVPHAGYIYSGPIAGEGYRQLLNINYSKLVRVFIIAPSHYMYFSGASVGLFDVYKTSLGLVQVSKTTSDFLNEPNFHFILDAHIEEHSIEVQLPFLQYMLPHFEIVPILYSDISFKELADAVEKRLDERSIIIVSSDLSHYYPYEKAIKIDSHCNNAVENLNLKEMEKCEACGKTGIMMMIYLSKKYNWSSKLVKYANSGDTAGPKSQVVGYASYAFYKEQE